MLLWVFFPPRGLLHFFRALLYRKHYLHEDSFDNIYITKPFLEMDAVRRKNKRPSVLPLSPKESTKYIRPSTCGVVCSCVSGVWMSQTPGSPQLVDSKDDFITPCCTASLVLPRKEQIAYALALARICRQFILVILLIVADFSVYWLFDLVRYHLVGEITARGKVEGPEEGRAFHVLDSIRVRASAARGPGGFLPDWPTL